ncbi:MAG: 50S ribosomal protein L30 [Dehalococcoidia bacterium]|nr:50S ribosomal protein L30 [Dehalococcoidia bacterium]
MSDRLRITWKRSFIGQREDHRRTIRALGLHRLGQTVEQDDSPSIRGMVYKVRHLVVVEGGSEK